MKDAEKAFDKMKFFFKKKLIISGKHIVEISWVNFSIISNRHHLEADVLSLALTVFLCALLLYCLSLRCRSCVTDGSVGGDHSRITYFLQFY